MTDSAALFRAINITILDYPLEAAVFSALNVCDEAIIVVGQSVDDTMERVEYLRDFYGPKVVKIRTHEYVFDLGWQERWWKIASGMTTADWLLWLDADEAFHENDIKAVRQFMCSEKTNLINFEFLHFFATPKYLVKMPLTRNTRLGRRSAGFRMVNLRSEERPNGAACHVIFGSNGVEQNAHSYRGDSITLARFPIYHYGWCRDPQALAVSQAKHFAWYADGGGLEDGRIPDVSPYSFQLRDKLDKQRAEIFVGYHPWFMGPWFEQHRKSWALLEASINESG